MIFFYGILEDVIDFASDVMFVLSDFNYFLLYIFVFVCVKYGRTNAQAVVTLAKTTCVLIENKKTLQKYKFLCVRM